MAHNIGVVDAPGTETLGIATRTGKLVDIITFGCWPKPSYEQLGVYHGSDSANYKKGDRVKITYYSKEEKKSWSLKRKISYYFLDGYNIKKIEKIDDPTSEAKRFS